MNTSDSLGAFGEALRQQTEKLQVVATTELLMAQAGPAAVGAYLSQVVAVNAASEAQRQAAAAAKVRAAAAAAAAARAAIQATKAADVQAKLAAAGQAAGVAFATAGRFAESLAQQANPVAWSTLQDSLGLVQMQLGQAFLPTIIRLAVYAQDFAHWLHDLSPATKELMSYVAGTGAALYLFGRAASFANVMMLGIPGKLLDKLGESLVKNMVSSGATNSVVSSLGSIAPPALALAVGLGLAAKNLYDWNEQIKRSNKQQAENLEEAAKPAEERLSRTELEGSEVFQKAKAATSDEERRRIISQYGTEGINQAGQADRERKAAIETGNSWGSRFLQGASFTLYNPSVDAAKEAAEAAKRMGEGTKKADLATATAREFGLLPGGPFKPASQKPEAHQTLAGKRAEQASSFLAHMPKEMAPRFSAVEEARKNFQIGALKDPLEQQKLQWERENNEAMARTIPEILRQIRGNTKGSGGLP